jgi:hypothetical protein
VSLATPEKIRKLQRALYVKAKQEPTRRFHFLYDKVWREDLLAHAYACCRANGGAPGVDGETFSRIESYGVERWLDELREEVRTARYQPQPVRRVMIPKASRVGQRPVPTKKSIWSSFYHVPRRDLNTARAAIRCAPLPDTDVGAYFVPGRVQGLTG